MPKVKQKNKAGKTRKAPYRENKQPTAPNTKAKDWLDAHGPYALVIHADEVGYGCFAGNVYVCAVRIDATHVPIAHVFDSKKQNETNLRILSEQLRNASGLWYAIAWRTVDDIARTNVLQAKNAAIREAVEHLKTAAYEQFNETKESAVAFAAACEAVPRGADRNLFLMDGKASPGVSANEFTTEMIKHGDQHVYGIAAASIIAKHARDAYMADLHTEYPQYGWDSNVGYRSPAHVQAMWTYGVTPYHRTRYRFTDLLEMSEAENGPMHPSIAPLIEHAKSKNDDKCLCPVCVAKRK